MRTTFTPEEIVRWIANDIETANDIERLGLHGFDPSIRQIMHDLHSLALSPTREDDAVAELEHRIVEFLGQDKRRKAWTQYLHMVRCLHGTSSI
jgi:hypothetical protein